MGYPIPTSASVASTGCDGAKPSPDLSSAGPSHWVVLAPEMFRAAGGIARVSRHYLQAVIAHRRGRPVELIVLNDAVVSKEQLQRHGAESLAPRLCNRSKFACLQAVLAVTRVAGAHVVCTHVHLAPLLWLAR